MPYVFLFHMFCKTELFMILKLKKLTNLVFSLYNSFVTLFCAQLLKKVTTQIFQNVISSKKHLETIKITCY